MLPPLLAFHAVLTRLSDMRITGVCRVMAMPYPPPLPLPVPTSMPPVPESLSGVDLMSIGLMNPEEELSNQQLNFTVRVLHRRRCIQHGRFRIAKQFLPRPLSRSCQ